MAAKYMMIRYLFVGKKQIGKRPEKTDVISDAEIKNKELVNVLKLLAEAVVAFRWWIGTFVVAWLFSLAVGAWVDDLEKSFQSSPIYKNVYSTQQMGGNNR